jgi:tripartite-type tricarboxylate transporter receptor subunit TctC
MTRTARYQPRPLPRAIACGLALCLALGAAVVTPARAQGFPSKPLVVISPFPPGGLNDTSARAVARSLQDGYSRPAVVENRPGGGTMIALEHLSRQPADGHTMLIAGDTNMAVMPHLAKNLTFSLENDFSPVTLLVVAPAVLLVRPGLNVNSVQDLVSAAKAAPGKLSFGSAGNATPPHMIGELFKSRAAINVSHVPFKGAAPALLAVMGDHLDFMFIDMASASAQLKSGKVKVLAVSSLKRSAHVPDVPTVAEQGFAGFEGRAWQGVIVRSGTPAELITNLNRVIVEGMKKPENGGVYAAQGAELSTSTPAQFDAMIREERAKFGALVKAANVRLD